MRQRKAVCRLLESDRAQDMKRSRLIIWIRILSRSMGNIQGGQRRSSSMRLTTVMEL